MYQSILRHFRYSHLPTELQAISKPFCDLAHEIAASPAYSDRAEVDAGLRKLLEAKDCIVRAALP